jgi:hypothetical protein
VQKSVQIISANNNKKKSPKKGLQLEYNHIYLCGPCTLLACEGQNWHLDPVLRTNPNLSPDKQKSIYFESAAQTYSLGLSNKLFDQSILSTLNPDDQKLGFLSLS